MEHAGDLQRRIKPTDLRPADRVSRIDAPFRLIESLRQQALRPFLANSDELRSGGAQADNGLVVVGD